MSQGQIVAVVSAVALVVSLFLAWGGFGGDIPDVAIPEGTPGAEALQGAADAAEDAAEPDRLGEPEHARHLPRDRRRPSCSATPS